MRLRWHLPARRGLSYSPSQPPDCLRPNVGILSPSLTRCRSTSATSLSSTISMWRCASPSTSRCCTMAVCSKRERRSKSKTTRRCRKSTSEGAMAEGSAKPALKIEDLHVYYGESHAIQGVSITLDHGVLAVVGRNGMGKSTLCNTITGLKSSRAGSIRILGRETSRLEPHVIHRHGVGYVPQGRRVWPSLSVDEHLRLVATRARDAAWTVDRAYQTFPRLYERRTSGGSQLSGGEQQMLAIARALLGNPRLLIMDEPTEGLAPVIVEQVEAMTVRLAEEGAMAVLVIEQNIGVATSVADHVAIMVNGRINRVMESRALAADRELQQRLLGVGRQEEEESQSPPEAAAGDNAEALMAAVYQIERTGSAGAGRALATAEIPPPTASLSHRWKLPVAALRQSMVDESHPREDNRSIFAIPFSERIGRTALVVGTFDTKGRELKFIRDRLKALGIP